MNILTKKTNLANNSSDQVAKVVQDMNKYSQEISVGNFFNRYFVNLLEYSVTKVLEGKKYSPIHFG